VPCSAPKDSTVSQPAGGIASGRDAKISRKDPRRAADSAGPQLSVFTRFITHDPKR
jgi:hypothetical protein